MGDSRELPDRRAGEWSILRLRPATGRDYIVGREARFCSRSTGTLAKSPGTNPKYRQERTVNAGGASPVTGACDCYGRQDTNC
jgi:hypothetical protein